MKTVLAAALVSLVLPGSALAQNQAAATLPNAFDQPAVARAAAPRPAPAPAAVTASDPAVAAAAEVMLKTTIAAMQAAAPHSDDMTPDLAAKVRGFVDFLAKRYAGEPEWHQGWGHPGKV